MFNYCRIDRTHRMEKSRAKSVEAPKMNPCRPPQRLQKKRYQQNQKPALQARRKQRVQRLPLQLPRKQLPTGKFVFILYSHVALVCFTYLPLHFFNSSLSTQSKNYSQVAKGASTTTAPPSYAAALQSQQQQQQIPTQQGKIKLKLSGAGGN